MDWILRWDTSRLLGGKTRELPLPCPGRPEGTRTLIFEPEFQRMVVFTRLAEIDNGKAVKMYPFALERKLIQQHVRD